MSAAKARALARAEASVISVTVLRFAWVRSTWRVASSSLTRSSSRAESWANPLCTHQEMTKVSRKAPATKRRSHFWKSFFMVPGAW